MRSHLILSAVGAALLAATPAARAETTACTPIAALPAVLSQQGIYCLAADLAWAGNAGAAITIAANNVTVDCNDHRVDGRGAGTGTAASGIEAVGRANATVRGCAITGFARGISLDGGDGHLVENNRLYDIGTIGIEVYGTNYAIAGNRLRDIGGGTLFFSASGIQSEGTGEIRDNIVGDVHATSTGAIGILTVGNDGGLVAGNVVRGVVPAGANAGVALRIDSTDRLAVRGNSLTGGGTGTGAYCFDSTKVALVGNHVLGFGTGLSGCVASGTTNVVQ
jgi:hypothetical protein